VQNLVARGEQKPAGSGSGGAVTTSPSYDTANHNVLTNSMDPSAEGTTDFAYSVGHSGAGDY